MRLDILKWNDHTFKGLSKEAKLIYCFLEAHCSTAGFLQVDEPDGWDYGISILSCFAFIFSLVANIFGYWKKIAKKNL